MTIDVQQMCGTLTQILAPNPTGGITFEALKGLLALLGTRNQLGTSLGNSMLVPMVEVFVHAKNWNYAIERKRGLTRLRGVVFKTQTLTQLADVLTNGMSESPEYSAKIEELKKVVLAEIGESLFQKTEGASQDNIETKD